MDFAVPADHREKLKESDKKDKYQDLVRDLKKLRKMIMTIGTLGTLTKGLVKRLEELELPGRVETIHSTELLRSARILRGVLET